MSDLRERVEALREGLQEALWVFDHEGDYTVKYADWQTRAYSIRERIRALLAPPRGGAGGGT